MRILDNALILVIIALIFNVFDFIIGFISAVKSNNVQSSKMRDGLFKKIGFIACYALAFLVDTYGTQVGLNIGVSTLPIIVTYTCLTEIVSIIENIGKINPDILPDFLTKLFNIQKGDK